MPFIAANVDARLLVQDAWPLKEWVRDRDGGMIVTAAAQAAVTALVLFLSALSAFSLMSISVSRRTREIGLRAARGANPRQVLARMLSRAMMLVGSGIAGGGVLLLLLVAVNRPTEEIALYARYFGVTSAIMLAASLLARIGPFKIRAPDQSHRRPEGGLNAKRDLADGNGICRIVVSVNLDLNNPSGRSPTFRHAPIHEMPA